MIGSLAVLSIWLALPKHFDINRTFREIGNSMEYRIGNYHGTFTEYRKAILGIPLITRLFRKNWEVADTSKELVGGGHILYYTGLKIPEAKNGINYIIQPHGAGAPAGFTRYSENEHGIIFIRDLEQWKKTRFNPPPVNFRSDLYDIPRESLYPFKGIPAKNYNLNLGTLPVLWKLFR